MVNDLPILTAYTLKTLALAGIFYCFNHPEKPIK